MNTKFKYQYFKLHIINIKINIYKTTKAMDSGFDMLGQFKGHQALHMQ